MSLSGKKKQNKKKHTTPHFEEEKKINLEELLDYWEDVEELAGAHNKMLLLYC